MQNMNKIKERKDSLLILKRYKAEKASLCPACRFNALGAPSFILRLLGLMTG